MALYIAYGSNLNRHQMAQRCPGARAVRKIFLQDAKLVFRHVLDVVYHKGSTVPCIVWEINKAHEHDLDRYEGVASGHYAKEYIFLEDGSEAMLYVMLSDGVCPPSKAYYHRVKKGYEDFKMDFKPLRKALKESWKNRVESETVNRRTRGVDLMPDPSAKAEIVKVEDAKMPAKFKAKKQEREARMVTQANARKITNLSEWLADRKASGRSY